VIGADTHQLRQVEIGVGTEIEAEGFHLEIAFEL
jgi:hypothetical protein